MHVGWMHTEHVQYITSPVYTRAGSLAKCQDLLKAKAESVHLLLEKWFPLRSERAHSLKLFCMYDKRFEISKTK